VNRSVSGDVETRREQDKPVEDAGGKNPVT
jgi:hypothetical protein